MDEGKLDISLLKEILSKKGYKNEGIVSSGEIGTDAASLDISLAQKKAQEFYDSSSDTYIIVKSDPVTFPTSEPGKYAVIVNANDISCTGAIPYGFLATIIAPPTTKFEDIEQIQKQIHQQCFDLGISILGGHTEISDSVKRIIVSGHMIGFVPKENYVSNKLSAEDSIIIAGEIGAEGIGIIISEGADFIHNILDSNEIEEGVRIGERLSLTEITNIVNKEFHPTLIHDATEGGLYGALSELLPNREVGIQLVGKPKINPILEKLSKRLEFDPYRVISSGLMIFAVNKNITKSVLEFLDDYQIPCSLIGTVTSEKGILRLEDKILDKPKGDEIIVALKNLERMKNERK
ncbi:MAG: AIR synthase-related protein [Candidatus Heimdallarchaeaceae archaeon]